MKNSEHLLIELLAATDALWTPIRDWSNLSSVAAILEMRLDFARRGLPVPRTSGGTESRKQSERLFDQIEQSGLAVFHRTAGRRTHWKLSDQADWKLRWRCGQAGWSEAMVVLLAVGALTDAGHTSVGYVPDWSLALRPGDGGQTEAARLAVAFAAELAAPALCRGWLTAWSDYHGAVGYKLTTAGRAILAGAIEKIERPKAKAAHKAGVVKGGKTGGKGRPKIDSSGATCPKAKRDESARTTAQAAKAVAIGEAIEKIERPKAKAKQRASTSKAGKASAAKRNCNAGETFPSVKRDESARTTAQAAKAVAIGEAIEKIERPKAKTSTPIGVEVKKPKRWQNVTEKVARIFGEGEGTVRRRLAVIESGDTGLVAMPDYSANAHDLYFASLDAALDELKTMKPKRENAISVFLGAGDWPSTASRKGIPPVFDRRGEVRTPTAWMRALARSERSKR